MQKLAPPLYLVFCMFGKLLAQNPCGEIDLLPINDTIICNDQEIYIFANAGFDNYAWSTDENSQGIGISFPGIFTVSTSFNTNNLVLNGAFSSGNTNFSSSYNYNQFSLWNAGTFSVTSNAANVHPNFNGTGNGNYLVVNGSQNPGSQVWCQDVQVNPNTIYNFSTLVNTVAIGNPAQLQFSINGDDIGNVFSAPNTLNNWSQFSATWQSGSSNTAEICIVNQNVNGSGNDFGLDEITFTTVCSASESINVSLGTQANATIFNVDALCETGNLVELNAVDQNGVWSGNGIVNTTNGLFSPTEAGPGLHEIQYEINSVCGATDTVLIEVIEEIETETSGLNELCVNENAITLEAIPGPGIWSGLGIINENDGVFNPTFAAIGENVILYTPNLFCASTIEHTIEVHQPAPLEFNETQEICFGEFVKLELEQGIFNSYQWSTNSTNSSILVSTSGDYLLQISDENLCKQEIQFSIIDKDNCELITMPNVFSPNNDNINDLFIPVEYAYVSKSTIKIFDRWGTEIWSTDAIETGWDGTHFGEDCTEGVYMWLIDFKTNKNVYKRLSGNVSLFR